LCWLRWTAICCASTAACLAAVPALRCATVNTASRWTSIFWCLAAGYRALRQLLTGVGGLNAIVRAGAQPLVSLR
jgi:hypothetical protein